jgi:hypothetical protein
MRGNGQQLTIRYDSLFAHTAVLQVNTPRQILTMLFTISKLFALVSLASLTGLAYADLATECMDAGGFTEVTLSSPNDVIESVLVSATCPSENAVFKTPSSINFIISPTEAGTSAKIYTNSANLVTPSLAGGTLQFLWKTGLPATQTSAGIILKIPRDQLQTGFGYHVRHW